ncbi:MAG: hypothetical protein JRG73_01620 [Deltaproteobacteria bacterium]|nr:hypothetical protein [Deltaproteobacteria bacterium]
MEEGKKRLEISGWYAKEKLSPEEHAARMAEINTWYDKQHTMNYRTVPLEIPGKMLATLGRMAMDHQIQFSDFIEGILDEYLTNKGISWH